MKNHFFAFTFTFFFSFIIFLAFTAFSVSIGQNTFGENLQIYILLASGSFFLAVANLIYSIFSKAEDGQALAEFTQEVRQSGSLFLQAGRLLFWPIFLPLWLVLAVYGLAEFYLFGVLPMIGVVGVLFAQFFWFLWRRRLFRLADSSAVAIPLYTPLRILLYVVDFIGILLVVSMVGVIQNYAFILTPLLLMGISLILAFGILAWNERGVKNILKADLPIYLAPLFLWITLVVATLNFALDISPPDFEVEVSYGDCPGSSNRMLTVRGNAIQGPLPDEVYYGCQLMAKRREVGLHSRIKIQQYRGALGISWLSAKKN